jgi:hypothetical protein
LAKRTGTPRKVVRATPSDPTVRRDRIRQGPPPPSKPWTGRALALLLGGMFIAAVLVIAEKAFGAAGHPLLGIFVGLACLVSSALIYWITNKKRSQPNP